MSNGDTDDPEPSALQGMAAYADAERQYRRVLAIYEHHAGATSLPGATTLHRPARVVARQGAYAVAETLVRRALAIRETLLGEDDPEMAVSCHELARLLYEVGHHAAAEAAYRQALSIHQQTLGDQDLTTARTSGRAGPDGGTVCGGRTPASAGAQHP